MQGELTSPSRQESSKVAQSSSVPHNALCGRPGNHRYLDRMTYA